MQNKGTKKSQAKLRQRTIAYTHKNILNEPNFNAQAFSTLGNNGICIWTKIVSKWTKIKS
jgi:hypothetical protein